STARITSLRLARSVLPLRRPAGTVLKRCGLREYASPAACGRRRRCASVHLGVRNTIAAIREPFHFRDRCANARCHVVLVDWRLTDVRTERDATNALRDLASVRDGLEHDRA